MKRFDRLIVLGSEHKKKTLHSSDEYGHANAERYNNCAHIRNFC